MEPVPDGSEATTSYLNSRYGSSNGRTIELPDEALAFCDEYERISEQMKELEAAKNAAANQLKCYLKEAIKVNNTAPLYGNGIHGRKLPQCRRLLFYPKVPP